MASGAEGRVKEIGIVLPALPEPGGNYLPAKTVGNVVYLAGVISISDGEVIAGTVGADRTLDEGYSAARACALIQLAVLKRHLGSLDAVKTIVTVNGYVNAIPGFAHPESVANFVRLSERVDGLFEGSYGGSCGNRQAQSRAQSGVDAVHLATVKRGTFCRGR